MKYKINSIILGTKKTIKMTADEVCSKCIKSEYCMCRTVRKPQELCEAHVGAEEDHLMNTYQNQLSDLS